MVCGSPITPMRAAVTVRQQTKRPLVLLGDTGELLGVVGEHELYRGMLRQTEYTRISKSPEPQPVETP
jgi:glycine betaine/proline transport system ATP-binding protein